MFPSESMVKGSPKSHFKKLCVNFSILKLQKGDAYQNGVEFRHKPNGNDVKWPPPLFSLPPPLYIHIYINHLYSFPSYIDAN